MSNGFENKLEKYAEVIVKVGLNLQPGQRLIIGMPFFGTDGTPLEAYPLVRQIAQSAYQAGARYVAVNWDDEELQRIRVKHAATDTMSEFPTWKNEAAIEYVDQGEAILIILSQNPDLMGGLEPKKVQAKQQTEAHHFHRLWSKMAAGATNWLAVSASIS
ncbi:MAG: aminopeptidase, partial [Chloroflexota bacterium]